MQKNNLKVKKENAELDFVKFGIFQFFAETKKSLSDRKILFFGGTRPVFTAFKAVGCNFVFTVLFTASCGQFERLLIYKQSIDTAKHVFLTGLCKR